MGVLSCGICDVVKCSLEFLKRCLIFKTFNDVVRSLGQNPLLGHGQRFRPGSVFGKWHYLQWWTWLCRREPFLGLCWICFTGDTSKNSFFLTSVTIVDTITWCTDCSTLSLSQPSLSIKRTQKTADTASSRVTSSLQAELRCSSHSTDTGMIHILDRCAAGTVWKHCTRSDSVVLPIKFSHYQRIQNGKKTSHNRRHLRESTIDKLRFCVQLLFIPGWWLGQLQL